MSKDLIIRSSSVEFLIFERQTHDEGIQVRFEDGDLWLTQKSIGELFNTTRNNITMHINDIYNSYELDNNSTSKKFLLVQNEGNREVKRSVQYYNLDMVISVGYKVNTDRAIQFRRWATRIDKYLLSDDRDILKDAGRISHEIACDKALTEFEKYRIKQDKLYKSDFDLLLEESINTKGDN